MDPSCDGLQGVGRSITCTCQWWRQNRERSVMVHGYKKEFRWCCDWKTIRRGRSGLLFDNGGWADAVEQKSDGRRGGKCHCGILTRDRKIFRRFAKHNLLYFSSKLNSQMDKKLIIWYEHIYEHTEKVHCPDVNEISEIFIEIEIPTKSHVKSHFNKVKSHHSVIHKIKAISSIRVIY